MEVKPGYKQTEIGVIPEEWEVKPLGKVLKNGRLGGNYPNQDREAEHPLMKMGNLARGYIDTSKVEYITPGMTPESQHKLAYGDVLFNTRNTLDLVGKVAIWRDELSTAYYNSNLMRLEFDPQQVGSTEYANYSLNTTASVGSLRALATGTTSVAAIYTRDLLKLPFVVPPVPEQRAIAGALSDVDELIGALDSALAKKHDLKQAAMQQLLTGKKRLQGFHGEWELKPLGEVCHITTGKKDVNEGNPSGQYPFFTCARTNTFSDSFSFEGEAILIAGNGEVGNLNYCNGRFEAYQRTYVLQGFTTNVSYLWHQLTAYLASSLGIGKIGSSIPYIKMGDLVGFEFRSPLDLNEQTAIAEVLLDMDAELAALEQRRDKTRALKQGMMQELLTGRTRLV